MKRLVLQLGDRSEQVDVCTAVIAGWAARDHAAVEEHIAELEALGVPRPSSVPVFYRVSAARLTTEDSIESTVAASGEVEAVLLQHREQLWVGAGSDHTDRSVETYSVAVSKEMCDKPVARELWPYEEVADHWDQLVLRSWIDDDTLYQEGRLELLMDAEELMTLARPPLTNGTAMFCGTVPAIGGIRQSRSFKFELADPVLGRTIRGSYVVSELPLVS